MAKLDPYNHKECYLKWKENLKGDIPEISKKNSDLILQYLEDMELGLNVSNSSRKGARGYARLRSLKIRLIFLSKKLKELFGVDPIINISERQIHELFSGMRNGKTRISSSDIVVFG